MPYTPPPRDPKATPVRINLLSDTQTRPTAGMREAMARAEVGDEQIGDDPTTNLLCERVAELLGKEAAVFMPSGTMCNVAATLSHCRPGDEILAHETAHIIAREGGAHAALGGFQITSFRARTENSRSIRFAQACIRARATSRRRPSSASNKPPISAAARSGRRPISTPSRTPRRAHGLVTHMDGARLLNACVATGISARDMSDGLGFGLDRFLQRPRRADRRGDGRIARLHRRGLALEAAARRIDAAVRRMRRGLRLRARSQRRPACGRSRQCARAGARAFADRWHRGAAAGDQSGVLQSRTAAALRVRKWSRNCASAACCSP